MSVSAWQGTIVDLFQLIASGTQVSTEEQLPADLCWPAEEVGQALLYLALRSELPMATDIDMAGIDDNTLSAQRVLSAKELQDGELLERWIMRFAAQMGLEAEPIQSTYRDSATLLASAGPALLQLPPQEPGGERYFVALWRGGTRRVQLLARDGSVRSVRQALLHDALWIDQVHPQRTSLDSMLSRAGIAVDRRQGVQEAILREVIGGKARQSGWLLRVPPRVGLWQQAKQVGLTSTAARLLVSYLIQLLLTVGAWWMIGKGALAGHFNLGWLWGWALLLISILPFQAWMSLTQSELAIGLGALFKQRLLFGVMQLDPEEIRHQGAGQFLGRVLASETVEQLSVVSGFVAVLALFQLVAAMLILMLGIGGALHALLLLLWTIVALALSFVYLRRSYDWNDIYREMTSDLVERMVGHRTRLAQEDRRRWHETEDQILNQYLLRQRKLDQAESQLKAWIPRGWMVIGVGGLLYALLFAHPSQAEIAISLGGILFAYQALTMIVLGIKSLVGMRIAWREIHTLFHAANRAPQKRQPSVSIAGDSNDDGQSAPILTARDVAFRYQTNGRPVLQGCNLELYPGERLLLEGPSGGGKSTLVALLAGLRRPKSGLLLLHNVDQETMGLEAWRERVVAVPQFHENYILTGTLAFNLLMGRRWPPLPADIAAAEALCRELGLGELIDRMPAGLQQMVGESGWQLSHGERSRVYIARALLQEADLLILDESFAALDPENLERTLQCVLDQAKTLVVIAHP